jgi:hypothetical protein
MEYLRAGYDQLRSPENRLYVGIAVGLLVIVGIASCLVIYSFFIAPRVTTPQPVLAPKAAATMTLEPTAAAFELSETSTPPVQRKVVKAATARVEPTAGQSCHYSSASLNEKLPPVPSGSWSPIEHYLCDNGYWDLGKHDVIDRKTGDWGQDGVPEKILIKYGSGGNIADRIFVDPEGKQFSGPKE